MREGRDSSIEVRLDATHVQVLYVLLRVCVIDERRGTMERRRRKRKRRGGGGEEEEEEEKKEEEKRKDEKPQIFIFTSIY